jgi:acyl-[acyl-carrier-protein]-phospholipid O-acyltransferase/long-chain-fatty-acid--[acyl-carrier-protein] ligase
MRVQRILNRIPAMTVRLILACVAKILFRIRIEGAERIPRRGGALLVANHVSYADSVLIGYPTGRIPRFLIWEPIYEARIARIFFDILHAIPIREDSPKKALRALRRARQELLSGELVAIFPEGAITRTGELLPFLRGFEKVTEGSDAPIIPMHIGGLYGHPLSLKDGKLFSSWSMAWRPVITIRVGEPVYGSITPEELRERVLELSPDSAAVSFKEDANATAAPRRSAAGGGD